MSDFEIFSNLEKMKSVGKLLYGDNWQSPLSRDLGVSDRTIRNYVSGETRVPKKISERLLSILSQKIDVINAATAIVVTDRIDNVNTVNLQQIYKIVDSYAYEDEQYRTAAIDAVNNAVSEGVFLSDLHDTASNFSI
ncbi:helix-turn-helix domain-containing protein [Intestinirhabdus alba]|jgi:predicted transcriptional regulator|uniref:Uncharacterized protein n=1 Tax=Intestinirhabdus alba TaxID=2899544 RepID=A0A6L6IFJ6_9ENTR|nr:hypothetical protein [Intestinirhabdus alba]MTH45409.1 hypothetical protein [Intestinirhabdus alba]